LPLLKHRENYAWGIICPNIFDQFRTLVGIKEIIHKKIDIVSVFKKLTF